LAASINILGNHFIAIGDVNDSINTDGDDVDKEDNDAAARIVRKRFANTVNSFMLRLANNDVAGGDEEGSDSKSPFPSADDEISDGVVI
jgi:hypothetical protein